MTVLSIFIYSKSFIFYKYKNFKIFYGFLMFLKLIDDHNRILFYKISCWINKKLEYYIIVNSYNERVTDLQVFRHFLKLIKSYLKIMIK